MQQFGNQTFELILLAVVTVALLFQTIILIGLFVSMRKAIISATEKFESLRSTVTPLIENSQRLLTRIGPNIERTSDDLTAITHVVRMQSGDLQSAANEIIARVRIQVSRLDALTTDLLDTVDRAGNYMAEAVARPMRQFSAILASARAAIESLRNYEPGPRAESVNSPGDNDMFV